MSGDRPGEMRIGERLEAARIRASLDLATVEDRTKIRRRYLRALEDENWEALPSSAYAKGFLRSYAELLGLDAEAMVDEYRRQVEGDTEPSMHPFGDKVLESRQRAPQRRERSRAWPWAAAAAIALGVALAVALVAGGDDGEKAAPGRAGKDRGARAGAGKASAPAGGGDKTVKLAFRVLSPVQVCLVGGGGQPLIDGQVLGEGDRERFERKSFDLRFPSGFDPDRIVLRVAGEHRTLPKARGPAAFAITPPHRIAAAPRPGEDCP
jgi:Helix-turn-helix domain